MAMRNRYGHNCQKVQYGKVGELVSLGYMEVIPGDTVQGRVSVDFHSAPTIRTINTRAYGDLYAFYIPYRVIWDEFPAFIAKQTGAPTSTPFVSDLFPKNFETRFARGTDGTPGTTNTSFMRRSYNKVYSCFFDDTDDAYVADSNSVKTVWQRPSTFEVANPPRDYPSVDISAATTVDDLRSAFARDQFEKIRQFYGDRYTDYLASLGVRVPWTVLEEPEPIGKKHHDLQFRQVSDTAGTGTEPLGFTAGYFKSKSIIDLKRTFIPEHGLVGIYAAVRADPIYSTPAENPALAHVTSADFWSPEYEMRAQRNYQNALVAGGNLANTLERPSFEHLRKGLNENFNIGAATNAQVLGLVVQEESSQNPIPPGS